MNLDSTETFFVVIEDSQNVQVAGYADNPQWVKRSKNLFTLLQSIYTGR